MPYKRIVVGTDGSETAERAVGKAVELAAALGSRLEIASAYEGAPAAKVGQRRQETPDSDLAHSATPASAAERLVNDSAAAAADTGVEAETWIREGDPSSVLIDIAREAGADLIVVGNKGMSGVSRFLLGSVPNKVSHHAPCAVLIVRTEG